MQKKIASVQTAWAIREKKLPSVRTARAIHSKQLFSAVDFTWAVRDLVVARAGVTGQTC